MSEKYKAAVALLTYFFMVVSVSAQVNPNDSLMYYLELAAKNNPTVLQKFSEYQAAMEKVPQAGSLPDPEVTIGVFVRPMELLMGNQTAELRLMQMFPWFGTLKSARDEMSLMAKAKYEAFREAKYQIFYDIHSVWYDLHKLNQNLLISGRNLLILRTLERLALVRFRTTASGQETESALMSSANKGQPQNPAANSPGMQGMRDEQSRISAGLQSSSMPSGQMTGSSGGSGLTDIYRIKIEISNLENNIEFLKDQQATLIARFNTFLNRPVQSAVTIADTLRTDALNMDLSNVIDSILKNNPMLEMIKLEQQSIGARKKMVSRMGFPMVGLGLDYSLINKSMMITSPENGNDMIMPMVSATIPIYRRKYKALKAEVDFLSDSFSRNYDAAANDLRAEYFQAIQLYRDSQRRMKLYSEQHLLASKSLDIMLKSFSVAGAGLTDILILRQQTLEYELKQVEAVSDFNKSVAWLRKLMAIT